MSVLTSGHHTQICVRTIALERVIFALLNARRDGSDGTVGSEIFLPFFGRRDPSNEEIKQPAFLRSIGLPIRFYGGREDLMVDVESYDAEHGIGVGEAAIAQVRVTPDCDTRHLRQLSTTAASASSTLTPAIPQTETKFMATTLEVTETQKLIRCHKISTTDAFGLLWALMEARTSGKPYTLDELKPVEPNCLSRRIPENDLSAQHYVSAFRSVWDIVVSTYGETIALETDDMGLVKEFQQLMDLYAAWTNRFNDWAITIIGTLIFGVMAYLMVTCYHKSIMDQGLSNMLKFAGLFGLFTFWAPFRFLYLLYFAFAPGKGRNEN